MCAPNVLEYVSRQLVRGDMLYMAAEQSAYSGASKGNGGGPTKSISFRNVADLTHPLSPQFPVFPAFEQMKVKTNVTIEDDGFYARTWELGEHTGTHVDAPAHFAAGADIRTVDEIPAVDLVVPLVVIDIEEKARRDHDAQLSVDDILAYERQHGRIPTGAAVCMYTGWETRVLDARKFLNADSGGTLHFPGFSREAANFLATERDVVGIGVDTISLDFGPSTDFRAHFEILSRNKWGLECLAKLGEVPPAGALLFVGVPKVVDGSGGPCRVLALW